MIPQLGQWVLWAATEAEATESVVPSWVKLLITISVFLIPYGLGILIARGLKLREFAFRISLVLFTATLGLMPFIYQGILGALEQQHYHEQLAEYEAEKSEFQVTNKDLEKIQEQNPTLKINRPDSMTAPPEISSPGE